MGLLRKTMSISTGGAVNYRSNGERKSKAAMIEAKSAEKLAKIAEDEAKERTKAAKREANAQALAELRDRRAAKKAIASGPIAAPVPVAAAAEPVPVLDVADQLMKLAQLRDAGVLTDDEFATQKAKLLNGSNSDIKPAGEEASGLAETPAPLPASWRSDPTGRHQMRYWDGTIWTQHVSDDGIQATDPVQ
jgi:Short C-terminal domain/Protein of unknown function (DUF2510)